MPAIRARRSLWPLDGGDDINVTTFRAIQGLPPYGPMATSFPASFARTGREGYVVEFFPDMPDVWVGNFGPGLGGYSGVHLHPNGTDVAVFSAGAGYVIDATKRVLKKELGAAIANVWDMREPPGLVCDRQCLAFFRICAGGVVWHTRRLAWDGFRDVVLMPNRLTGLASGLDDAWLPFEVDLTSGASSGGSVPREIDHDWERLAVASTGHLTTGSSGPAGAGRSA